jgi:chloride channel protein, CIC family
VGAWLFRNAAFLVERLSHGWVAEDWSDVGHHPVLLAPAIGGLLVGVLLHLFEVDEEPTPSVTEALEVVTSTTEDLPLSHIPIKSAAGALSLGSGAALGTTDPTMEIGAGVGRLVSEWAHLPLPQLQSLVVAGVAGGLADTFHAPLMATAFAVETFRLRLFGYGTLIAAAAALAAVGIIGWIGPAPEPEFTPPDLLQPGVLLIASVIVVATGAISAGEIRLVFMMKNLFLALRRLPRWAKPAIAGLVLSGAGFLFPELLGIGYGSVEEVLRGDLKPVHVLLLLAAGKGLLMALSFGDGFRGGFFAPSLFAGAMFGAAIAAGVSQLVPELSIDSAAGALVGMAAMLAGTIRAPFAVALLMGELSGSHLVVPPLLLVTLATVLVSRRIESESLYTYELAERGEK